MVQTTAATHPSKGEGFPQTSPCRADPSQDVLDLMATMDLNFGEGSGASAGGAAHANQNQNANPNHPAGGKKSKWRKKLDRVADQQTLTAAGGKGTANAAAAGAGGGAGHTNVEFAFYSVQPERKAQKKKGKKKLPKKSVVVEITSPPVLPPGAYAAEADGTSPSTSSNDKRGHGKKKKSKAKKGGRKGPNGGDEAEEDFSTNAGGAAVLAALGQYPWVGVYPNAVGVDHDYPSAVSTPTMEGEGGYQMPYDPNAYAAYGQPYYGGMPYYPHVEATQQQPGQQPGGQQPAASSGTVVMPAGYYVPVFYGQQQGGPQPAVEYQQPVQFPVYYPQPGYAPYGAVPAEQYSAGSNVDGTHSAPSTPLNVDAPAFNPKGFEG